MQHARTHIRRKDRNSHRRADDVVADIANTLFALTAFTAHSYFNTTLPLFPRRKEHSICLKWWQQ